MAWCFVQRMPTRRFAGRLMVLVLLIKSWTMSTHWLIAVFDLISRLCMVHVLLHHNRNGKRLSHCTQKSHSEDVIRSLSLLVSLDQ